MAEHYEHAFVTCDVAPKPKEALALKYALDPIIAAELILILAPVFVLVMLAIALSMSRLVLFVQERAAERQAFSHAEVSYRAAGGRSAAELTAARQHNERACV